MVQTNRKSLLGMPIDPGIKPREVLETLANRPILLSYLNPYAWKVARTDRAYVDHLASFDLVVCDGIAIQSAIRKLLKLDSEIISLDYSGIAEAYLSQCQEKQRTICLVGAQDQVLKAAVARLKSDFPDIKLVNSFSGYGCGPGLAREYLADTQPDMVLAGLGMGLQERFLLQARQAGWTGTGIAVGGFFERLAQPGRHYPPWAVRYKLRFLSNILQKPGYYLRRYGVDYLPFMRQYSLQRLRRSPGRN